jgi:FtsP/CotA-like multicopper oxidase with cupredoxin domain
VVQAAPNRFGAEPGFGYVLQQGNLEPAPDSIASPGAAIILTRDEAVRITVVNHLAEPTAVHWHGIELPSYPDGVPGWSGVPPRLLRPIAPGDSFAAEFTPPRSGTFIYHTHFNETRQLGLGLYGPLLVLDPGTRYDPGTDHVVIVGLDGSSLADSADTAHALINGRREPAPLVLRAGVRHRLRLINIDPNQRITFALMRDSVQLDWRPVAKDGADLPPALSGLRPARLMTGPGETADFEIEPREPGNWRLVVSAPFITKPWSADLPITVQ